MKKLYLLSAAVLAFAMNMNAQEAAADDVKVGWGWTKEGGAITKIEGQSTATLVYTVEKEEDKWAKDLTGNANCWDAQLVSPIFNWGKENAGKAFIIEFKAAYEQAAGYQYPRVRIATGKNGVGADQFCTEWNAEEQKGASQQYLPDSLLTDDGEYKDIKYAGYYAGGEVQFEIDFGHGPGVYTFSMVKITIGDQVVHEAFNENAKEEGTAISDAAANGLNAYVANGVVYASEAANIVVYNVNGVACKVANNASSVNVDDLNSGLYIVKVSANGKSFTTKFVK